MEYSVRLDSRALVVLNNIYRSKSKHVEYERKSQFNEWAKGFCLSPYQLEDTVRNDLYGIVGVIETREYTGHETIARHGMPENQSGDSMDRYYARKSREIEKRGNTMAFDNNGRIYERKVHKCVKHVGLFIPKQNIIPVRNALRTSKFKKDVPEESLDVLQYISDYTSEMKEKWPRYTVKFHPTGVAKDMYGKAKKEDVTEEEKATVTKKLQSLTGLLNEMQEKWHYIEISRWSLPTRNIPMVRDILYENNVFKARRLLEQKRDAEWNDNKQIKHIPQSLLIAC